MDTKLAYRQKAKGKSGRENINIDCSTCRGASSIGTGPLLFLIYINDLEDGVASNILKFADDTKLFRRVQTIQESHTLQDDLNRLDQLSEQWQMLFNQSKCKCLHIGRANGKEPYEMHNTVLLKKTAKEKDIGVTISADWKVSEQCGIAARKGPGTSYYGWSR